MIQDAASRFPQSISRPPPPPSGNQYNQAQGAQQQGQGLNLRIGPVSLNVGGSGGQQPGGGGGGMGGASGADLTGPGGFVDPGRIGEAAQGAANLAGGLFGRLRDVGERFAQ